MASSDTSALTRITVKLKGLENPDPLLREIATSMLAIVKERIHEKGLNSAGGQIGTYSNSYLEYRAKVGKNTGRNVILALTGQMENDFKIVAQSNTRYALGFSNSFNAEKAGWAEEKYGKVYNLTSDEKELVKDIIDEYIANLVQ